MQTSNRRKEKWPTQAVERTDTAQTARGPAAHCHLVGRQKHRADCSSIA